MFHDRLDAAGQLAERLAACQGRQPLVLAIPRGAVPMARRIAERLGGDFDVVLARKLCAPTQPELAIGSIDEHGWTYIAPFAASAGADAAYLAEEQGRQLQTLRRRRALYTPVRAPLAPAGRTVIVVDDGLATGATMVAALHALREQQPARLLCAAPVASPEALRKIRPLADEVVCLLAPPGFQAVGQFYRNFPQIEDEEVIALLRG
jgi:predicted phosphoribosyltransferase